MSNQKPTSHQHQTSPEPPPLELVIPISFTIDTAITPAADMILSYLRKDLKPNQTVDLHITQINKRLDSNQQLLQASELRKYLKLNSINCLNITIKYT